MSILMFLVLLFTAGIWLPILVGIITLILMIPLAIFKIVFG